MDEIKFVWTSGDHTYILVPDVRLSPRKTWLLGAGMYDLGGNYIGYWHRGQMPVPLIRSLTSFAREHRSQGWNVPPVVNRPSKRRAKKR